MFHSLFLSPTRLFIYLLLLLCFIYISISLLFVGMFLSFCLVPCFMFLRFYFSRLVYFYLYLPLFLPKVDLA